MLRCPSISDGRLSYQFSSDGYIRRSVYAYEKMAFSYSYALSRGVDTQFRHINIAEADHFKQFLRQIKRAGLDIRAIC
ncbi:hypothetical protein AUS40_28805 [Escherichia coli]|nr:hypothetical protein [Escherichia coli]KXN29006.1 hypothetical protein AUS40_28805 [Escherichia coli]